jgi:hypothetical protein
MGVPVHEFPFSFLLFQYQETSPTFFNYKALIPLCPFRYRLCNLRYRVEAEEPLVISFFSTV